MNQDSIESLLGASIVLICGLLVLDLEMGTEGVEGLPLYAVSLLAAVGRQLPARLFGLLMVGVWLLGAIAAGDGEGIGGQAATVVALLLGGVLGLRGVLAVWLTFCALTGLGVGDDRLLLSSPVVPLLLRTALSGTVLGLGLIYIASAKSKGFRPGGADPSQRHESAQLDDTTSPPDSLARSWLAAGVAHDINNSLQVVGASLSVLEDFPGRQDVQQACSDIAQMAESLMDLDRSEPPRMKLIDLDVELSRLQRLLARQLPPGVTLAIEVSPKTQLVANGMQVRQAVLNLALNSIQAMPSGGALAIRASVEPGHVLITVTDTGIGMDSEMRSRVLRFGTSSKSSGRVGFGLSNVRAVARAHGGDVRLESNPGRGTSVSLVLPSEPPKWNQAP